MIHKLNDRPSSHILKIDMNGAHPENEYEDYLAVQISIVIEEQIQQGFYLRAITFCGSDYILVFTPN